MTTAAQLSQVASCQGYGGNNQLASADAPACSRFERGRNEPGDASDELSRVAKSTRLAAFAVAPFFANQVLGDGEELIHSLTAQAFKVAVE